MTNSNNSFRFTKHQHLKSQKDFAKVYAARCRVYNEQIIVFCVKNSLGFSRLGLSVSKKVGNSPTRNRWKRLIREAFRLQQHQLPIGFDFVVIPQPLKNVPNFETIQRSVLKLFIWNAKKYRKRFPENIENVVE